MYARLLYIVSIILSFCYGFFIPDLATALAATAVTTVVLVVGGASLDRVRG